ncbi:MAG TPA: BatD family protein [Candidatus Dormibacteraeota bacterium]|nr:BatD family protein [Candidatus Dormibacteraeota bacterium]
MSRQAGLAHPLSASPDKGSFVTGLIALCLFLLASDSRAATFAASLDRDTITLGESATLSLVFSGGKPNQTPQLPGILNLQLAYAGESSQFRFDNGQTSSSVTHSYTVTPRQTGDYTIPALTFMVGSEKLSSSPLHLKVLQPGSPPPQAVASGNQLAFLKLVVPKKEMFVGETTVIQLQLYVNSRVPNANNFQITSFPADGFVVGKMVEGQHSNQQVGNAMYTVVPLQFPIHAVKPGQHTLGPVAASIVLGRSDPFFEQFGFRDAFGPSRQLSLGTDPETIQTVPLPKDNVPRDFNGAIGSFTMNVSAGPTNVTAGDPITVKVQISGRGTLDSLTMPEPAWQDFKTLPATTKVDSSDPLGLQGTKTFEQVVTPQSADVKEIPSVSFSYFDPEQKAYRTLSQPAIKLSVRPGGAVPMPTVVGTKPAQENPAPSQDIVPIKQNVGTLAALSPPLIQQPWFLALQGMPLAAFISAFIWRKRTEALANNPRLRRQRQVAQVVRDGLAELRTAAAENNSEKFFATLFHLLQEQLGERLDVPASSITEAVVEERLRPRGVPETAIEPLQELFQTCNLARYAPIRSSQELAALIPKVESVLSELRSLQV